MRRADSNTSDARVASQAQNQQSQPSSKNPFYPLQGGRLLLLVALVMTLLTALLAIVMSSKVIPHSGRMASAEMKSLIQYLENQSPQKLTLEQEELEPFRQLLTAAADLVDSQKLQLKDSNNNEHSRLRPRPNPNDESKENDDKDNNNDAPWPTATAHVIHPKDGLFPRKRRGIVESYTTWTWYNFTLPDKPGKRRRRMAIVQYSGAGTDDDFYVRMINISEPVNRAYAKVIRADYCRLSGVAYGSHLGAEATYNKLYILQKLKMERYYDVVLLLDSDAVIIDLDFDALDLIPEHILFTADKVFPNLTHYTWDVNAGVTLWNLKHPRLKRLVSKWEERILHRMRTNAGTSDQGPLHYGLRSEWTDFQRKRWGIVQALHTPHLHLQNGTFVRHFTRGTVLPDGWNKRGGTYFVPSEERLAAIEDVVNRTCKRWEPACDKDGIYEPPRKNKIFKPDESYVTWYWYNYSGAYRCMQEEHYDGTRKLAIVQYTGFNDYYFKMTDRSEIANRAYAKAHKADYARMNGVAYGSHEGAEATYNKLYVLQKLQREGLYDAVLILDSDAVIIDLDLDVLTLLPEHILFTADKVEPNATNTTWNVNAGVTLWNLRHMEFTYVLKMWERRIIDRIKRNNGVSDQGPLHFILNDYYTEEERERLGVVNALDTEHFRLKNGTFVKHFIRGKEMPKGWNKQGGTYFVPSEARMQGVEKAVEQVCRRWPDACDNRTAGTGIPDRCEKATTSTISR